MQPVPFDDHSIETMLGAIRRVRSTLEGTKWDTYSQLYASICGVLEQYEQLGGGVEQFRLKLTKSVDTTADMSRIVKELTARCDDFIKECDVGPKNQVNDMLPFVRNTSTILVHGCGKLLALALACAVQQRRGVRFLLAEGLPATATAPEGSAKLLLTRARETNEGYNLRETLPRSCTIIPDSAVASVMTDVDFVLMGAHCVTEHGGLVHSTGSLQLAMVAAAMNVPCYVLCETFKFTPIFPLSTKDLIQPAEEREDGKYAVPRVEFIPPSMITLLFTEQGIMPPSAVADEMFRTNTATRR